MYHSLQWSFYKYRTLVPNSSLCQTAHRLRTSCELCHQSALTEEEKRQVGILVDNNIFDHGGARRSGFVGIFSDPGAWKQDARRSVELPNLGKEGAVYTTM